MKTFAALASLLCFAFPAISVAEPRPSPIVVELFTSQGCASCPPADALMHKLSERDDVLALAFHVDYWDYIGWKDIFADPAYTARQKAYAQAMGHRMVHTPQMIVMGQEDIGGADPMALADAIARHRAVPSSVSLSMHQSPSGVTISLRPVTGAAPRSAVVDVIRYAPLKRVAISRGELAGRTIDYANIVEEWTRLADWNGAEDLTLTVPLPGDHSLAVLVQEINSGPILAAAALRSE
ncbi:DUF1223 domain-containing protein [Phycobacter sp. K97]|uniref:DUF1223 domain-containing protein n=1 Tax=Phycobacter sedimenti TaxID=3133977 RepID=UPI00311DE508